MLQQTIILLSDADYEALKVVAADAGETVGEFLRRAAVDILIDECHRALGSRTEKVVDPGRGS